MSLIHNPIGKVDLFATPDNMEEFQKYLGQFNGSEAVVAQTCAWMAWNLASSEVEEFVDLESTDV